MPKTEQRISDAVWDKTELINTPSGVVRVIYFIEQIRDASGNVIEQRPRERVIIRPDDNHLNAQERGEIERIARKEFLGVRKQRYGE